MRRVRVVGLCVAGAVAIGAAAAAPASATAYGVMGWGAARSGDYGGPFLGNGSEFGTNAPVGGDGLSEVTAVSGGLDFGLALLADGTPMAWGGNKHGELGDGETSGRSTPIAVSGVSGATSISAGGYFSLALLSDGEVMAWGDNEFGELGIGTSSGPETCSPLPETIEGREFEGNGACSRKPVKVSGLSEVIAVATGARHGLALLKDGKVMAWGDNEAGELGNGTTTRSSAPVEVEGLSGVVAVAAGYNESLALLSNGTVMAWGGNAHGQLGIGATTGPESCSTLQEEPCSTRPVEVTGLSNVTAISAGYWNEIALLSNGTVKTWGNNTQGQLGNGNDTGPEYCAAPAAQTACSSTPLAVSGVSGAAAVSASIDTEVLTRLTNGTVMAWGNNSAGQLGIGTEKGPERCDGGEFSCSTTPVTVKGLADVAGISAGGEFGLAMVPAPHPPEFGRCLKVDNGAGRYETGACTKEGGERRYEWYPGVMETNFTSSGGSTTLETVSGSKVVCSSESGTGEYGSPTTVANVVLRLHGCSSSVGKCKSKSAAEGEVVTSALSGALGIEKRSTEGAIKDKVALDFAPTGAVFAELSCAGYAMVIRGSVLGSIATNAMALTPRRNFLAVGGKQKPEQFEGEPKDVLEESLLEGPFVQAGLTVETVQTNEERIEVNSVT